MQKISKAFSFVEIIISISITSLLIIILLSTKQGYEENLNNTKIVSDLETINNALTSYSQDLKSLPMPGGNTNFYSLDTSYRHSFEDSDTFGVYGSITETTIPKKYLDATPLDPRTNSYYAYGKTKSINEFEIASVQYIDTIPVSKVIGNYTAEFGPFNLIREYNGPNFVKDKSKTNFPYNPDELILIVTDQNGVIYREGDTVNSGTGDLELFFSDGSVSILEPGTTITLNKLNFKGKDNLNSFVKIALGAGTIWTRATKLNDESSFEIYTSDTNATVRGTIFKMTLTDVTVIEGEVDIYRTTTAPQLVEEIKVLKGEVPQIYTINNDSLLPGTDIEVPDFTKGKDPREPGTVAYILKKACPTLIVPGEGCIPDTTPTELTASGYQLVAYAPYNQAGDIKMYSKDMDIVPYSSFIIDNNNQDKLPSICLEDNASYIQDSDNISTQNKQNSFCEVIGTKKKGIFIDNDINDGKDKLLYNISNLNLGENFAIEMSVKFPDTVLPTIKYLFQLGDYKLFIDNYQQIFLKNYTGTGISISGIINGNFHKIVAQKILNENKISSEYILYIDGIKKFNFNSTSDIGTDLYIGSSSYPKYQINDIIDYVKIYKK